MPNQEMTALYPVDNPVESPVLGGNYLDTYALVNKSERDKGLQQKNLSKLVAKYLYHSGYVKEANRLSNCGQNWIPFTCSQGHTLYRQINCGLPYCPKCSKTGAWYNKKRIKKVNDVLLGFPMIGHYVFTLPKEISQALPSADKIDKLYKLAWRVLKEFFEAEACVVILHFCGDKTDGLHIHFDCSFPILYRNGDCSYPLPILNLARAEWTQGVNEIFGQNLKETVCHYNFVNTLEQERHLIKYITRSTIEANKFIELPEDQKGYCLKLAKNRNIRYFGKFVGKKKAPFLAKFKCSKVLENRPEDIDLVNDKVCPICNEKMKPASPVFMDDIPLMNFERYNGYTLVDRQIGAFLRERDRKWKKESSISMEEAFFMQEVEELLKGGA